MQDRLEHMLIAGCRLRGAGGRGVRPSRAAPVDFRVRQRPAASDFAALLIAGSVRAELILDAQSIDSKVDATLAWYDAHLHGFKKRHAYAANRSQDTFYHANGTIAVSVTGSASKKEENTDAYSVVYARFQPGLAEKTPLSFNQQKVVCQ